MRRAELTGQTFGVKYVEGLAGQIIGGQTRWAVRCLLCGRRSVTSIQRVREGKCPCQQITTGASLVYRFKRQLRDDMKARGFCWKCGGDLHRCEHSRRAVTERCRIRHAARTARDAAARRAKGLCAKCSRARAPRSTWYCEEHLAYQANYGKTHGVWS